MNINQDTCALSLNCLSHSRNCSTSGAPPQTPVFSSFAPLAAHHVLCPWTPLTNSIPRVSAFWPLERRIHGWGGGEGAPRLGPKNFTAQPKNKHICKPPFCMPECAKTHLQQSRISKFSGGGPRTPLFKGRGGEGREGEGKGGEREEREGKGKRGKGRIGKGGEGREGTGEGRREGGEEWGWWGGEGRGARHGLRPPPRDKFWIRPWASEDLESGRSYFTSRNSLFRINYLFVKF